MLTIKTYNFMVSGNYISSLFLHYYETMSNRLPALQDDNVTPQNQMHLQDLYDKRVKKIKKILADEMHRINTIKVVPVKRAELIENANNWYVRQIEAIQKYFTDTSARFASKPLQTIQEQPVKQIKKTKIPISSSPIDLRSLPSPSLSVSSLMQPNPVIIKQRMHKGKMIPYQNGHARKQKIPLLPEPIPVIRTNARQNLNIPANIISPITGTAKTIVEPIGRKWRRKISLEAKQKGPSRRNYKAVPDDLRCEAVKKDGKRCTNKWKEATRPFCKIHKNYTGVKWSDMAEQESNTERRKRGINKKKPVRSPSVSFEMPSPQLESASTPQFGHSRIPKYPTVTYHPPKPVSILKTPPARPVPVEIRAASPSPIPKRKRTKRNVIGSPQSPLVSRPVGQDDQRYIDELLSQMVMPPMPEPLLEHKDEHDEKEEEKQEELEFLPPSIVSTPLVKDPIYLAKKSAVQADVNYLRKVPAVFTGFLKATENRSVNQLVEKLMVDDSLLEKLAHAVYLMKGRLSAKSSKQLKHLAVEDENNPPSPIGDDHTWVWDPITQAWKDVRQKTQSEEDEEDAQRLSDYEEYIPEAPVQNYGLGTGIYNTPIMHSLKRPSTPNLLPSVQIGLSPHMTPKVMAQQLAHVNDQKFDKYLKPKSLSHLKHKPKRRIVPTLVSGVLPLY